MILLLPLKVPQIVGAWHKWASRNIICRKPENSLSEIQAFLKNNCAREIQKLCKGLLNTSPHLDNAPCTVSVPQRRACFI